MKWIYKTKYKPNGEIENFKAKLIEKGYSQEYGIDYEEIFALVSRMDTVKMILALGAQNNWPIFRLDFKSTFLK